MILLGTEVNLLTLAGERRRPQPVVRECVWILALSLPGAVAGVALLRALDPVALQVAVSVGVVATLAARHLAAGRHLPGWGAPVAGFAAGGLDDLDHDRRAAAARLPDRARTSRRCSCATRCRSASSG